MNDGTNFPAKGPQADAGQDWTLRSAGIEDVDRLALVGAATFLETYAGRLDGAAIVAHCQKEHAAATYAHYLNDGGSAWLVEAKAGGAPIGYALLAKADLPGSRPEGDLELKRIYSFARFHGSGLGRALMDAVVEHARWAGAARLLLGVNKENRRAIAFYRKQGFEPVAERRFQVGDAVYDDLVLGRPL